MQFTLRDLQWAYTGWFFFKVWIFQSLTLNIIIFKTYQHQYILIYLFLMKRKQNIDEMITIQKFRQKIEFRLLNSNLKSLHLNSVCWIQIWNFYFWIQCTEFKFQTSTFEFSRLNSSRRFLSLNTTHLPRQQIDALKSFFWIKPSFGTQYWKCKQISYSLYRLDCSKYMLLYSLYWLDAYQNAVCFCSL